MKYSKWQRFDNFNTTEELDKELQSLVYGQSIIKIEPIDEQRIELTLSNGVILSVCGHEGCSGCENGNFYYDEIITLGCEGNIITKVNVLSSGNEDDGVFTVQIFSIDKRFLSVDYHGCDNGYYGVGVAMVCKIKE